MRPQTSMLVFLPGHSVITEVHVAIRDLCGGGYHDAAQLVVHVLHTMISSEDRMSVFEPLHAWECRVVLATNMAESSLTIPGVRVVIDSGLLRTPVEKTCDGWETLATEWYTASAAEQRMGRAGRVAPGTCVRLYSQKVKDRLGREIRAPLTEMSVATGYLFCSAFLADVDTPRAILGSLPQQPPSAALLDQAEAAMQRWGALSAEGVLTWTGYALPTRRLRAQRPQARWIPPEG